MSRSAKIRACLALAESTTHAGERAAALAAAERLRAADEDESYLVLGGPLPPDLSGLDDVLDRVEWAAAFLDAHPAPADFTGRTDMWLVRGHGPALDNHQLVRMATERGFFRR